MSAFRIEGSEGLVLDTVKRGEDDEDVSRSDLPVRKGKSVILRVYDTLGGRARGFLRWGPLKVAKVWKCNILEDDLEALKVEREAKGVEIEVRAFEVATYRLLLES
ncbi:hypothetical protein B0A49_11854 [Cryomyces minteri]|uniref:Glycosyl hydrolases family 38 C-terminal domain-containing protein n=1 Tax=Cryomyces minteri TaxID=331657 RepID=A0A4U0VKZ5_9PEZI|nr:hypothetical protein B0A49_11854 [Cryomyces minteri]